MEIGVKVNGPWWVSAIYWAQAAWRVALAALLLMVTWQVYSLRHFPDWAQRQIQREADATRGAALAAIGDTRKDLLKEVANTRVDVLKQVNSLQKDTTAQVADLTDKVLGPQGSLKTDLLARVDTLTGNVNGQLNQLQAGLKPTLTNVASITAHADEASAILFRRDALPAQTLGLIAATKVTMGQTALTMRDIQNATPGFLTTLNKIGANSDAATVKTVAVAEESRRLMHNLAENTTPLPKWIRYPAQVIGLVGSAAVPVVTLEKLTSVK